MVNAFRELNERAFGHLMCPIDNVLRVVYESWYDNIERSIEQYVALSTVVRNWEQNDNGAKSTYYKGIRHDFGSLVGAVKLFFELGLDPTDIRHYDRSFEQKIFVHLVEEVSKNRELKQLFWIDVQPTMSDMVDLIKRVIEREIKEEENQRERLRESENKEAIEIIERRIERLWDLQSGLSKSHLQKVVIHGVHQFSPLQLRFVELLDSLGIEVVFLFNYVPDYPAIYETWKTVYGHFGVDIEHDQNVGSYGGEHRSLSHRLARALGDLLEGKSRQSNASVVQEIEFRAFRNVTEYTAFVSQYFNEALEKSRYNPFDAMSEKVYTASREIHDLLRVYYPEHSGERHFLFYPIGQFFLSLYEMWDPQSQTLKLDWDRVRECFNSDWLKSGTKDRLLTILDIVQPVFSDVQSWEDFEHRLAHFERCFDRVQRMENRQGQLLRHIVFYDQDILNAEDIQMFAAAVRELNDIGRRFFSGTEDYISFSTHFEQVIDFMEERMFRLAGQAEKELVHALVSRLGNDRLNVSGSMEDLNAALFFYLRQSSREDPGWIVRNFEQIEGDILRSRKQRRNRESLPVYHFGSLSDTDMIKRVDDLLPWPLTDEFVRRLSSTSWVLKAYHVSLSEYSNFMRYALFYGLYFNEADVRLSYIIEGNEDRKNDPYYLLQLLGLKEKQGSDHPRQKRAPQLLKGLHQVQAQRMQVLEDKTALWHRVGFLLCPHRYFCDFVLNGKYTVRGELPLKRYYANMLVDRVWEKTGILTKKRSCRSKIEVELANADRDFKEYLPFWQEHVDFYDLNREAQNYLSFLMGTDRSAQGIKYDRQHMNVRIQFAKGKYLHKERHPYPKFAAAQDRRKRKHGEYEYSWTLVRDSSEELLEDMAAFFFSPEKHPHCGDWCVNCPYDMLCLERYRRNRS